MAVEFFFSQQQQKAPSSHPPQSTCLWCASLLIVMPCQTALLGGCILWGCMGAGTQLALPGIGWMEGTSQVPNGGSFISRLC